MLYGLTLICGFLLAGEALGALLGGAIPGSVLGMVLMTAWLLIRREVTQDVATVSSGLLKYLPLLFVPAGVGLIDLAPLLSGQGIKLALVILLSTVITLVVTALVLNWLLKRRERS